MGLGQRPAQHARPTILRTVERTYVARCAAIIGGGARKKRDGRPSRRGQELALDLSAQEMFDPIPGEMVRELLRRIGATKAGFTESALSDVVSFPPTNLQYFCRHGAVKGAARGGRPGAGPPTARAGGGCTWCTEGCRRTHACAGWLR